MSIREQENKFKCEIGKIINDNINKIKKDYTIEQSSDDEDTQLSFDLLYNFKIEISVRLRTHKYKRFKDITIRTRSKKGNKTEIDKLMEGMGNLYFYGWLNENETRIDNWIVIDINKIRHLLKNNGTKRTNYDGTEFKAYDFKFLKDNDSVIVTSDNK